MEKHSHLSVFPDLFQVLQGSDFQNIELLFGLYLGFANQEDFLEFGFYYLSAFYGIMVPVDVKYGLEPVLKQSLGGLNDDFCGLVGLDGKWHQSKRHRLDILAEIRRNLKGW